MNVEEICEYLNDIGVLDINRTVQFLNLYTGFISNNKNFLNNQSSQKNSIKITLFAYLKNVSENDKELYRITSNIVNSYDKNKLIKQYHCICNIKKILFYKLKNNFFNFLFNLLRKISIKTNFNRSKGYFPNNDYIIFTDGSNKNKYPKKIMQKSKKIDNYNEITKKMILKQEKINHNNMKKHLYDEQTRINNFNSILPNSYKCRKKELLSRDEKNYLKKLKSERHYQKLTEKQINKNDLIDRLYRSEIIKIEDKKRKENADKRRNIKKSPIDWDKVNIENSYKMSYNNTFNKSVPNFQNYDNQEFIPRESIENNFSFGTKEENQRIHTHREIDNKFNNNKFISYEENNGKNINQYSNIYKNNQYNQQPQYNQQQYDYKQKSNNNYINEQNYYDNNYDNNEINNNYNNNAVNNNYDNNVAINNNYKNNENFEESINENIISDSDNKVVNENNNDFVNEDCLPENDAVAQNIGKNNMNNNQIPLFKSTNINNNKENNNPENLNNKDDIKEKKEKNEEKYYDFPQQYTGKETIKALSKNDNNIKEDENKVANYEQPMQIINTNNQNNEEEQEIFNNENNQLMNNNNENDNENNENLHEEEYSPDQIRDKYENNENDYYNENNNNYEDGNNNFNNNYNNEMGGPYMDEEGNMIMNPQYVDEQGNFINNYNNECYNEYEGEEYEEQDMNMNNEQNYQENAGNMPKIADRVDFNELFGDNADQMENENNQN